MQDIREDMLNQSSREVVDRLRARIATHGRITFARFMEVALYDPEVGYYRTASTRAGFAGDFLTAPETHPIFGHALARQIAECFDRLDQPVPFVVREDGAGSGTLALTVMEGLQRERPDVLSRLNWHLVDVNEERATRAVDDLGAAGFGGHATAAPPDGAHVLLANELLDAFPFHRLEYQDGALHEIYVTWRHGWFADEVGPLSGSHVGSTLAGLPLAEGQRLEVSPAALDWASRIGSLVNRGYAFLIDYGYPADELYDARQRPSGTLRSYSRHLVSDDPYRRVGDQDLTAHVDFSAVTAAAIGGGMQPLGLSTQAYFFAGLGIEELLLQLGQEPTRGHDYLSAREAVMHLLDPRGLGRFRVLVLGRDVPTQTPLRGLSFSLA